ncbi:MAG: hypothetical protein AWT59_3032 [Candidatus Gallionella acididurans]|uniref:Uncharacterized protein n=1 Tax=Candidatus Gallionella acididurans TaxID=1796491 RepID=A0A139BPH0_9PROT|nr:MAG: hypothetical protein AWT59_3032 [Candidatus Gallionella acididurans]
MIELSGRALRFWMKNGCFFEFPEDFSKAVLERGSIAFRAEVKLCGNRLFMKLFIF